MAEIWFKIPDVIEEDCDEKEALLHEVGELINRKTRNLNTRKPVFDLVYSFFPSLRSVDICGVCGSSSFIFGDEDDALPFLHSFVHSGCYGESFGFGKQENGEYIVSIGKALKLDDVKEVLK